MSEITLYKGDCLEKMNEIKDKSIDLILTDLPYGTTSCDWDKVIPFEFLWEQYERIIKDHGCIAEIEHRSIICATENQKVVEKVFLPNHQVKDYKEPSIFDF